MFVLHLLMPHSPHSSHPCTPQATCFQDMLYPLPGMAQSCECFSALKTAPASYLQKAFSGASLSLTPLSLGETHPKFCRHCTLCTHPSGHHTRWKLLLPLSDTPIWPSAP